VCELMGMCFQEPIAADFTIREFALRAEENADGWGLGWYPDGSVALAKEPLRWGETKYTAFLETYSGMRSTVYLAHVRHKTVGDRPTHADTHPFVRELDGRAYCFAHNGTLRGTFWEQPLGRFRPLGATDSERLFCLLLADLSRRGGRLDSPLEWSWLAERLLAFNEWGKLNCLLSDGRRLFAYHDRGAFKGLTFRKVLVWGHNRRHFEDPDLSVNLEGETVNHGYVLATRPLSRTGWERFHPGELIVFARGEVCFSTHRDVTETEQAARRRRPSVRGRPQPRAVVKSSS
jgi:predicted glutamine amidotransferase